jgi:hypothetical protein
VWVAGECPCGRAPPAGGPVLPCTAVQFGVKRLASEWEEGEDPGVKVPARCPHIVCPRTKQLAVPVKGDPTFLC